jgi:galactonate dehydratase
MSLQINITHIPDPDGHNPALLLKGDWLIVQIDDGTYCGYGEASHSCNDSKCKETILKLFNAYVEKIDLSIASIEKLSQGPFSIADSFVTATAISGLNQALHDLVAKRDRIPVWKLYSGRKCQTRVPVYATINRALTTRTFDNYHDVVTQAVEQGFSAIKCAPFEKVDHAGDQISQCEEGLLVLK